MTVPIVEEMRSYHKRLYILSVIIYLIILLSPLFIKFGWAEILLYLFIILEIINITILPLRILDLMQIIIHFIVLVCSQSYIIKILIGCVAFIPQFYIMYILG